MLTTVWLVRGELKLATLEMTHSNRRTHPGAHPRQVVNHSPTGHGRTIQPPYLYRPTMQVVQRRVIRRGWPLFWRT